MGTETIITAGTTVTVPIGYQPDLSSHPGTGYSQGNQGWDGQQRPRDGNTITGLAWVVDSDSASNPSGGMVGSSDQFGSAVPANGWSVSQADATHLTIQCPPSATVGTRYAAYCRQADGTTYHYAVFDVVAGGGGAAAKTVTGLYNLVNSRMLVSSIAFTVRWSDALALDLDYSRDGGMASDAAYAAATWTTIPVSPAPPNNGGSVGLQSWQIALPYFLDAALIRLTCVGSGGSAGSAELTDFRLSPAPFTQNLWSSGDTGLYYPAPLLVDGAVNDGSTGYDGA